MLKPSPETLVDRLRGIYQSAVSPYKPSSINVEAADEIERLRALVNESPVYDFKIGDKVEKYTGDYVLSGVIRAQFCTEKGHVRYVVEHQPLAPGMLHIYSGKNIRKI